MFDLIISGGTVVDGSGSVGYPADVGIKGEHIEAIERQYATVGNAHIYGLSDRIDYQPERRHRRTEVPMRERWVRGRREHPGTNSFLLKGEFA